MAEGREPLPEDAQSFLDKALELLLKSPVYVYHGRRLRGGRSRLINDYVSRHTTQMIREWFTVKDEDIDTSDPDVFTYAADFLGTGQKGLVKVTNRLYQADVNFWVFEWLLKAEELPWKNHKALVDDASASADHNYNGAYWHRDRLAKLRTCKEEKAQQAAERRQQEGEGMIEQLEATANSPVDYEPDGGSLVGVKENSIYPAFAAQLREYGLNESSVFDVVLGLSGLIRQSVQILPTLTADMVKQFEARVLLSYYRKNRQERESAQAAKDQEVTEKESYKEMQRIYIELLQLDINLSSRNHSDPLVEWFDVINVVISGLVQQMLTKRL